MQISGFSKWYEWKAWIMQISGLTVILIYSVNNANKWFKRVIGVGNVNDANKW